MQKGDYIIHNGSIAKITNDNYYDVIDNTKHEAKNIVLHQPNIIINEAVLDASGFVPSKDNKYIYSHPINDKEMYLIGEVTFDLTPLKKICDITFSLNTDGMRVCKQIVVLSELQDFVRINTGQELCINIDKLAEAIK